MEDQKIDINYLQYESLPKLSFWSKLFSDLDDIENEINYKNEKLWKKHVDYCIKNNIIAPSKPVKLTYKQQRKTQ